MAFLNEVILIPEKSYLLPVKSSPFPSIVILCLCSPTEFISLIGKFSFMQLRNAVTSLAGEGFVVVHGDTVKRS